MARIATPPAKRARIEPSLPVEPARELDARSTAEASVDRPLSVLAPSGPEAPPRPMALAAPEPAPECDDPPAPGGVMPAPNRAPEELLFEDASALICLA